MELPPSHKRELAFVMAPSLEEAERAFEAYVRNRLYNYETKVYFK